MGHHPLNSPIVFVLLALFGAITFLLASWASNQRMLSTPADEDEQAPAEIAWLADATVDARVDEDDDEAWTEE